MPKRFRQRKIVLREQDRIKVRLKEDFVIPAGTELELGAIEAFYRDPTYEVALPFSGVDHPGYLTLDEDLVRAHPELFEVTEPEEVER